jgi:peptide/nickel transport system permease protein
MGEAQSPTLNVKGQTSAARRRRIRHSGMAQALATGLPLVLLATAAIAAPWLPIPDAGAIDLGSSLSPPVWAEAGTWDHVFGTDQLGRDLGARLLLGARLTLLIALSSTILGAIVGTTLGMLAGYVRGWTDFAISRVIDAQLAIPFLLLAITIMTARGQSVGAIIAVLAIIGWAQYARVIRSEVLTLRSRPFVLGLQIAGASSARIIFRHVLPNIADTLVVLATLQVGYVILAESALSFIGLGVTAPNISWGAMLADGRELMTSAWWLVAFPGAAITLVVVLVSLLGDSLKSRYDPRARAR